MRRTSRCLCSTNTAEVANAIELFIAANSYCIVCIQRTDACTSVSENAAGCGFEVERRSGKVWEISYRNFINTVGARTAGLTLQTGPAIHIMASRGRTVGCRKKFVLGENYSNFHLMSHLRKHVENKMFSLITFRSSGR